MVNFNSWSRTVIAGIVFALVVVITIALLDEVMFFRASSKFEEALGEALARIEEIKKTSEQEDKQQQQSKANLVVEQPLEAVTQEEQNKGDANITEDSVNLRGSITTPCANVSAPLPQRKPKLADGCSAVYLDCGSNIGVQVRKLFEPELYPNAKVLPYFEKHFGKGEERRKPGKVCAFGFEANPGHVPRLKAVEECYNKKGWRTHFLAPIAVLNDDNQTIEFFRDKADTKNNWGSSIFDRGNARDSVKVPTIHLGRFIMEEIVGRLLPEGETQPGPVYAKFDIEGAEYQTFGGLITSGALCYIDEASTELHRVNGPDAALYTPLAKMVEDLGKMPAKIPGCKTMKMDWMDDESFLTDGLPTPEGCDTLPNGTG